MSSPRSHHTTASRPHVAAARLLAGLAAVILLTLVPHPLLEAQPEAPDDTAETISSNTSSFSELPLQLSVVGRTFRVAVETDGDSPTRSNLIVRPVAGSSAGNTDASARLELPDWLQEGPLSARHQSGRIAASHTGVLISLKPASRSDTRTFRLLFDVAHARPHAWHLIGTADVSEVSDDLTLSLEKASSSAGSPGPDYQVVRTDQRLQRRFCGLSAHPELTRSVWDPDARRFDKPDLIELVDVADRLSARVPDTPLSGPFTADVYTWFWSGNLAADHADDAHGRPAELGDRRPGTIWRTRAWHIGGSEPAPAGFASARISDVSPLRSLRIVPGDADAPETFSRSTLPNALLLVTSDGRSRVVDLPDVSFQQLSDTGGLVLDFPDPIETNCLTVAPLSESEDAPQIALSEITPVLDIDKSTAQATADAIVARILETPARQTRRQLTEIGLAQPEAFASALQRRLEALSVRSKDDAGSDDASEHGATGTDTKLARLVDALGRLPSARAVPVLIDLFDQTSDAAAHTPLRQAVRRSLANHGTEAADALMARLSHDELDDDSHLATLRLLNRVAGTRHRLALVDHLGSGSWAVREERNRVISTAGEPALDPVMATVAAWPSTQTGRDALRVASRIGRRPEADPLIDHNHAGAVAAVLTPDSDRRTLLLAARAAEVVRTHRMTARTADLLDHPDPLVRRALLKALQHYRGERARELLVDGLDDESPDVRIAAVNTLGARRDTPQVVAPLMSYLKREHWRAGRLQAIRALVSIETPATTDFIERILTPPSEQSRDASSYGPEIREMVASALLRAGRPPSPETLFGLLEASEGTTRKLRLRAVDLLGLDDSSRGLEVLTSLASGQMSMVGDTDGEASLRTLRQRAILALGRRRSSEARSLLASLVFDPPEDLHINTRRHAIRALGFYTDPSVASRLRDLHDRADPALKQTIRQAITMIDNRQTLDNLQQRIDDIEQRKSRPDTPNR